MLTAARATEVWKAQMRFPFWGNCRRFMTTEEAAHVDRLFRTVEGNPSFASLVLRIAHGETFNTP